MSTITILEHHESGYRGRTLENARQADTTLAFAVDFTTTGEKLTRKAAGRSYVPRHVSVLRGAFLVSDVAEIRSGGQTGFDLAGLVAGHALGLPVTALFPKGFLVRGPTGRDSNTNPRDVEYMIRKGAEALL